MTGNLTVDETSASNDQPYYPGFGEPEDVLARIHLLHWTREQIANGNVQVKVGDCVLATEGRILGVGQDPEELDSRVFSAEPKLRNARVVGCFVYSCDR